MYIYIYIYIYHHHGQPFSPLQDRPLSTEIEMIQANVSLPSGLGLPVRWYVLCDVLVSVIVSLEWLWMCV